MSRIEIETWFRLDLRSLALFRILLGAAVATDLLQRAGDWSSLYADTGVLPAREWLYFGVDPWPVAWFCDALGLVSVPGMALGVAASLAMAIGLCPRLSAAFAWLVLSVAQARNPFVNYGADVLLRMLLLWSTMLPIGAAWTYGGPRLQRDPGAAGEIGLQLQVFLVFVIAGLVKLVSPEWQAGVGVIRALDHDFLVTEIGRTMGSFPGVLYLVNFATVAIEVVGPFALYCPWRRDRVRIAVLLVMGCMCVGFNLGLHVGLFPVAGFIGLSAYVPGAVWERLGLVSDRSVYVPSGRSSRWLIRTFAGAVVIFALIWNVGLWRSAEYVAPWPLGTFGSWLRLEQKWGMFTYLPSTGWLRVVGRLADGSSVDLLAAGGPLPSLEAARAGADTMDQEPDSMATRLRDIRWRVYMLGMVEMANEQDRRAGIYGRYLCREWNRRESGPTRLNSVILEYASRPLRSDPSEAKRFSKVKLGEYQCPTESD